jgi:hypothetical protein
VSRDVVHNLVKNALIKDGWKITHDPFLIGYGNRKVYADLGAEKLVAAEKGQEKIVIEIKSFLGVSLITELERALGQFMMYRSWRILSKNRGKFPKFVLSRKMPWIQTSEIFCPKILR